MNQDNETDTVLMNFRVPIHLKDTFDQICKFNHQSKTSVLLMLIRDFVEEQSKKIGSELKRRERLKEQLGTGSKKFTGEPEAETWNGYMKDPETGTWSHIGD